MEMWHNSYPYLQYSVNEGNELDLGPADVLSDLSPLPKDMTEAAQGELGHPEAPRTPRQGNIAEEDTLAAASDEQQQQLQHSFREKWQIPPLRLGIMILLTAGDPLSGKAVICNYFSFLFTVISTLGKVCT